MKTISIMAHYPDGKGKYSEDAFELMSWEVSDEFTEERMLRFIEFNMPYIDWQHDDLNQYVCYTDPSRPNCYLLATMH